MGEVRRSDPAIRADQASWQANFQPATSLLLGVSPTRADVDELDREPDDGLKSKDHLPSIVAGWGLGG
tara:strand:- start:514854 stop:515057 length:204 start_codon:yes stop_codon:yes gene_type:complete